MKTINSTIKMPTKMPIKSRDIIDTDKASIQSVSFMGS